MEALPDRHTGPALLDLQLNGYAGFDFNSDPDRWSVADLERVGARLRHRAVGAALPTLITAPAERLVAAASRYAELLRDQPLLAEVFPRLHIEGPFISPEDGPRGAHPLQHCSSPRRLPHLLARLRDASGDRIGILTLAPELPGALRLIEEAIEAGICVALGHTAAPAARIDEAVAAGASLSTHLGNGSHLVLPRLDNYVQRQLADDRLMASFIADGHHVPWGTLQSFLRAKTLERSILVTDAIAAADAAPGIHTLGALRVEAGKDGVARVPGQPNLAGSALTLDRAVINVTRHCGVPFADAWLLASRNPARLLGVAPLSDVTVQVDEQGMRVLPPHC